MNKSLTIQRQKVNANFAKNLVLARNAVELTQSNLSEISNVSRTTIAQIESGEGDPRLSTVIDIATSLGVSPILLLMGSDEMNALVNMKTKINDIDLSNNDIDEMERLISTGIDKNKIKAAKLGVSSTIGLSSVGAAIGTVLLPGVGTIAGAIYGYLSSNQAKSKDSNK
jgi:DNA-binding XRE family transcriptional regulator